MGDQLGLGAVRFLDGQRGVHMRTALTFLFGDGEGVLSEFDPRPLLEVHVDNFISNMAWGAPRGLRLLD